MYPSSNAFHTAVQNGAKQLALLIFNDCVFTNADINVSSGIQFNDYFNTEEDISIGQASSNEVSFGLFNDDGALNEYSFGEFTATLGAQISSDAITGNEGTVQAESSNGHKWVAYEYRPYIKRDNVAVSVQPDSPVRTIVINGNDVYCRSNDGTIKKYSDADGSSQEVGLYTYMNTQINRWYGKGIAYWPERSRYRGQLLKIWERTKLTTYEFVPLGKFIAERPNVPAVNEIRFTCYDLMTKFDKDMPTAAELATTTPGFAYGNNTTIANLLDAMCAYVGIERESGTFINSTAKVTGEPEEFRNATMRDVVKWIAEAAGSNARINRDGKLELAWLRTTSQTLAATNYAEFAPYWYTTPKVTKLYNRNTQTGRDLTTGSGDEAYLIQDNPLLKGVG